MLFVSNNIKARDNKGLYAYNSKYDTTQVSLSKSDKYLTEDNPDSLLINIIIPSLKSDIDFKIYLPVDKGIVSVPYGGRTSSLSYHRAIDICNSEGTPLYPVSMGIITYAGFKNSRAGNTVRIDHRNGYTSLYCHISKILVKVGDTVSYKDTVALMGHSGHSYSSWGGNGDHLHFEFRKNGQLIDPNEHFYYYKRLKDNQFVSRHEQGLFIDRTIKTRTDTTYAVQIVELNAPLTVQEKLTLQKYFGYKIKPYYTKRSSEEGIEDVVKYMMGKFYTLEEVFAIKNSKIVKNTFPDAKIVVYVKDKVSKISASGFIRN